MADHVSLPTWTRVPEPKLRGRFRTLRVEVGVRCIEAKRSPYNSAGTERNDPHDYVAERQCDSQINQSRNKLFGSAFNAFTTCPPHGSPLARIPVFFLRKHLCGTMSPMGEGAVELDKRIPVTVNQLWKDYWKISLSEHSYWS